MITDDLVYREIILDHYKHPRNFGRIKKPSVSYGHDNPLCGDDIGMDIVVNKKTIKEIAFYGQGCAISMASSSLLTEHVLGKNIDYVLKLKKENVLDMLGTQLTPTRLKCALLPLEVLHKALSLLQ